MEERAASSGKEGRGILLSNQSTTYLFRSLCDRMAEAFPSRKIYLLAGACEFEPGVDPAFTFIKSTALVRNSGWKRFVTWSLYSLRFLFTVVFRRFDLVMVTTNPPFCPWLMGLVNTVLCRPYIVLEYDIYPDVIARMWGVREDSFFYRRLVALSALSMRKASAVVTLGEDMAGHLRGHFADRPPEIQIIPNWSDTTVYRPVPKAENAFALEHNLADKFVVMYSGAFGATHDMDSMLKAAAEVPEAVFVFIGKGTRYEEIEAEIERLALSNVLLLPWQPLDKVPLSLAAADCHIVTLDGPYAGISFPSKFYTSIGVGAAILAVAPEGTDLSTTVCEKEVGRAVRPGDPEALAQAVRDLAADPGGTAAMRERSRKLAEEHYDERSCTRQYAGLVGKVLEGSGTFK